MTTFHGLLVLVILVVKIASWETVCDFLGRIGATTASAKVKNACGNIGIAVRIREILFIEQVFHVELQAKRFAHIVEHSRIKPGKVRHLDGVVLADKEAVLVGGP